MNENIDREYVNKLQPASGLAMLFFVILLGLVSVAGFIFCVANAEGLISMLGILFFALLGLIGCPFLFSGLRSLRPNEACVLTFFGEYYGTLYGPGFFFVNPLATTVRPAAKDGVSYSSKISLKELTLNNDKQKINDELGNPVMIGTMVIWNVVDPAKAVFNVDNYFEFLSSQCDAALRNIVREYPYDISDGGDEKSLRGSSQEVAQRLADEIQSRVAVAGIEIIEARITHLAYATEIAAAMLQRQQAAAIIDARKLIVDGAVGMVEMALERLSDDNVIELTTEQKAQMVSNLLVVLCGNSDTQPVVDTSAY